MSHLENLDEIFFDHSEMIGYLCDTKTYELLYMTKAAMKIYGMTDENDYRGQTCHKVIHGLDEPCPFCTNDSLSSEHEYRWEHYNEKLARWFDSTDRLIMIDGRPCRMQISKDVSVRRESDILSAVGNITKEDVLYRCLNILTEEEETAVAMERVLETIGAYYKADRTCIFEVDMERQLVGSSFAWSRPGFSSGMKEELKMDFDTLSCWLPVLERGLDISVDAIEYEVDRDSRLFQILMARKVNGLILAPLIKNGQLVGFLSVDNPHIKAGNMVLLRSVSIFILEELQRRNLSEQLDFANTQTDIQQMLDFIRKKLDADAAFVLEALTTGGGILCTNVSVADERYRFAETALQAEEKEINDMISIYDEEGLCDRYMKVIDKTAHFGILHYGIFFGGEFNGCVGVIDFRHPDREWVASERDIVRKAGQSLSNAVVSSRLNKLNTELKKTQSQLSEAAVTLRQERQMYRDAMLHGCDYAYIVNVSKNKIEDVYKGGFLEQYSFSADQPYDEAMNLVVEKMKPVILHGMKEFHLTSHYIAAYEQGQRMVEVEYYVPDTGAYKRKSLFLSKDEYGTMYVFVVTHDITASRQEELETEKSLTQLAEVAKEVGRGNLDVEIDLEAPGLVGILADVLSQTIRNLKWHMDKLNQQATQDPMTGVKNKRVWQSAEDRLNKEIKAGTADFGVVVFDVNDLKLLNDTEGHEAGDDLIIRASRYICDIFKHSPVYRIGGDEFTVILEGEDLENCDCLLYAFDSNMAEQQRSPEEAPVSIAMGMGRYKYGDMAFSDVFQRADEAMYQRKNRMKSL